MDPYLYPDDGPIRFRRERDLGDVIRAAMVWMREMAGTWVFAVLVIAGPLYVLSAVISALVDPESPALGLLGLVDGIAGLLMSSILFGIVRLYRIGETELSIGAVWQEAKAWIWPQIGFGFLTAFFGFLLVIPFVIIVALGGGENISPLLMVGLGLAGLVLLAFAAPYYALGLASRILDEDSAVDAYKRASGLISAHRWLATGTTLVIFGVVYFIIAVFGGGIGALLGAFGASPVVIALATVVSTILIVPAGAFSNVASMFLFEALVEREEGTLLDDEIDAIREGAPKTPRQPVVPPPLPDRAILEEPDTRSFAERLRDDRQDDELAADTSADQDASSTRPSGFRGGGFGDAE
ncbi:MAG: hypothetical protein Rubg2KO_27630 [Rubricoccaceae bacterium]